MSIRNFVLQGTAVFYSPCSLSLIVPIWFPLGSSLSIAIWFATTMRYCCLQSSLAWIRRLIVKQRSCKILTYDCPMVIRKQCMFMSCVSLWMEYHTNEFWNYTVQARGRSGVSVVYRSSQRNAVLLEIYTGATLGFKCDCLSTSTTISTYLWQPGSSCRFS